MFKPLLIAASGNVIRVSITGYIGEDVTDTQVLQQMQAYPEATEIEVYINSGGGSVPIGNAIGYALRQHPAKKTAYIIGACASMATMIALSCDTIKMDALAEWMVHLPITTASGRSDQLEDAARISKELEQQFVKLYAAKTGMPEDQMLTLLREERWLSAQRALELGFIDEVMQLQIAAFYTDKEADKTPNEPIRNGGQGRDKTNPNPVKMKGVNKALGLPEDASENAAEDKAKELAEKLKVAEAKAAEIEKQLADVQAAQVQADAETMVEEYVQEGRVEASAKTVWVQSAIANMATTKLQLDSIPKPEGNPIARRIAASAGKQTVADTLMREVTASDKDEDVLKLMTDLQRANKYTDYKDKYPTSAARMIEAVNRKHVR